MTDDDRFYSLPRMIRSRRAVNGLVAAMIAGLFGRRDAAAAPCPKGKKRCGGKCIAKRGCCKSADCRPKNSGQVCRKNRCVCPGGMKRCGKRCVLKAAACPPKPDASCPPGSGVTSTGTNTRVAQVFTEPNGGRLTAAAMRFANASAATTGLYEFRVQTVNPTTGVPEGKILGGVTRSANTISATAPTWVRFDLPVPIQLLPGRQYALVLTLFGTGSWFTETSAPAECPGGDYFFAPLTDSFVHVAAVIPYQTFVRS